MKKPALTTGLVSLLLLLTSSTVGAQTLPPAGTWATIPNTAIAPVSALATYPELGSVASTFFYSGGDIGTVGGKLGFLFFGGGHGDGYDNSIYFSPFDSSGPQHLTGPYLVSGSNVYKIDDGLDYYTTASRNNGLTGAPKSRHTYSGLAFFTSGGTPYFFSFCGALASGAGGGTGAARMFDLTQSYAAAMARGDMGWVAQDSFWGGTACAVGWDPVNHVVVARSVAKWGAFNPATGHWTTWGDAAGGVDYATSMVIDPVGRKAYAIGGIIETADLDTHAITLVGYWQGGPIGSTDPAAHYVGPAWGRRFASPGDHGRDGISGAGAVWHPGRQRILIYPGIDPLTNTNWQDVLQIDPVTGITERLHMSGVTVTTQATSAIFGRFRLIPGTDTVVLAGDPSANVYIGTLPAHGEVVRESITGKWLGQTGEDFVGPNNQTTASGTQDWHIRLHGVHFDPVGVYIQRLGKEGYEGDWIYPYSATNTWLPYTGTNSIIHKVWNPQAGVDYILDLWLEPNGNRSPTYVGGLAVTVTYADGTWQKISDIPITALGALQSSPSPGTVWVAPGNPIPPRHWVERRGVQIQSDHCNTAGIWDVELCHAVWAKHERMFYHPYSRSVVIAGGDRATAQPRQYSDGTGTEIVSYNASTDTWAILRPMCVPSAVQPNRPDNIGLAYDATRDRALFIGGYRFDLGSGCGANEPHGSNVYDAYAFNFLTASFTGPNTAAGLPTPYTGWGTDGNSSWGTYDPVNDEYIRLIWLSNPVMQRLNLGTQRWRETNPMTYVGQVGAWGPSINHVQPAIDVVGRAIYWLDADISGSTFTGTAWLVKTSLVDGTSTRTLVPSQWVPPGQGPGTDEFMVFDPGNRLILIPNNDSFEGTTIYGLGIYHVDTGVWEWDAVPAAVQGSAWAFDENLGVLVGTGTRNIPTNTYLWKYGPKP